MRWTAEKVEELRAFAHLGSAALALRLGVTVPSVESKAGKLGVSLGSAAVRPNHETALRARWAEMLPGMRERVREAVRGS